MHIPQKPRLFRCEALDMLFESSALRIYLDEIQLEVELSCTSTVVSDQ